MNQTAFRDMLAHLSGGRRYAFVIMKFDAEYSFYKDLRSIVMETTGFECFRADDLINAGGSVRAKIHAAIQHADVIIADISDPSPNVFYEIGFAAAQDKPLLLLKRQGVEPPIDLKGVETIEYSHTRHGLQKLDTDLRQQLTAHVDSAISLLRAMVVPPRATPSFILTNPKIPTASSRIVGHPRELRTYGDYLGVVRIIGAFTSVFGEACTPHLVSAEIVHDDVLDAPANLFLIGSPKVNKHTRRYMELIQAGGAPNWKLEPLDEERHLPDGRYDLTGMLETGPFDSMSRSGEGEDYGLILRGPHPESSDYSVSILAGPRSLGTGAACLTATTPELIRQVEQRLPDVSDLRDRSRSIWILVRARATQSDQHLDPEGIEIVAAGCFG